jgi:hypothetical protein
MPAGDAQRAWFPEMLSELKPFWDNTPDWSAIIAFCDRMTSIRLSIWERQGIRGPIITCRSCGKKHAMTMPPVSPRSLIFALRKIDVITDDELKRLDKQWKRFRNDEKLDALGHFKSDGAENMNQESTCIQSQRNTS